MTTYTIDRAAWRCGGSVLNAAFGQTHLLNERGFKCCLGFVCEQDGVKDLLNKDLPCLVTRSHWLVTPTGPLSVRDSNFARKALLINDDEAFAPRQRERQLQSLAQEAGHEFVFVGEYPEVP